MILSVFALYVIYDLSSSALTEVHVYIRHAHALRIEKTFEIETVLDRVYIRYSETVGYHAARGRSATRPDRYLLPLGKRDEIRHDEKIVSEPHSPNHVELIFELFFYILTSASVPLFKTCKAELSEVVGAVLPFRHGEFRQMIMAELEFEIA